MVQSFKYVECDACHGAESTIGAPECYKCGGWGTIEIPEVPDEPKRDSLLRKAFLLILWLAIVFVVTWEFFGWLQRFK